MRKIYNNRIIGIHFQRPVQCGTNGTEDFRKKSVYGCVTYDTRLILFCAFITTADNIITLIYLVKQDGLVLPDCYCSHNILVFEYVTLFLTFDIFLWKLLMCDILYVTLTHSKTFFFFILFYRFLQVNWAICILTIPHPTC